MKNHLLRRRTLGVCLLLPLLALPALSQSQPSRTPTQTFMRLKLEPAKQILEGIATENFDLIAQSAQQVQTLTLDEKWNVLQSQQYADNSEDFQRAVQLIREAAKNKNLDGATLAYMQMTLNCVQCHRDLRKK